MGRMYKIIHRVFITNFVSSNPSTSLNQMQIFTIQMLELVLAVQMLEMIVLLELVKLVVVSVPVHIKLVRDSGCKCFNAHLSMIFQRFTELVQRLLRNSQQLVKVETLPVWINLLDEVTNQDGSPLTEMLCITTQNYNISFNIKQIWLVIVVYVIVVDELDLLLVV